MITGKRKLVVGAAVAVLAAVGATSAAVAAGSGDDNGEQGHGPITGPAYDRATARALEVVGSGRVTETEVGDEESYYQVEITKPDGSQVDVNLDESFDVVHTKAESPEDGED
jgi:hypothetical protein